MARKRKAVPSMIGFTECVESQGLWFSGVRALAGTWEQWRRFRNVRGTSREHWVRF